MGFTAYRVMNQSEVEEAIAELENIQQINDRYQRVIAWVEFGYSVLAGLVCPYGGIALAALFAAHATALSELDSKIEDNLDILRECKYSGLTPPLHRSLKNAGF
ncbi:MAG: hypothetical protein AB1556_07245 [Bacillota bacterium]